MKSFKLDNENSFPEEKDFASQKAK